MVNNLIGSNNVALERTGERPYDWFVDSGEAERQFRETFRGQSRGYQGHEPLSADEDDDDVSLSSPHICRIYGMRRYLCVTCTYLLRACWRSLRWRMPKLRMLDQCRRCFQQELLLTLSHHKILGKRLEQSGDL